MIRNSASNSVTGCRDPLWAFLALTAMPFRIWKRLLGFMFILLIVTFVVGMGGGHFLEQAGFERGSPVYVVLELVTLLALAAISVRRRAVDW